MSEQPEETDISQSLTESLVSQLPQETLVARTLKALTGDEFRRDYKRLSPQHKLVTRAVLNGLRSDLKKLKEEEKPNVIDNLPPRTEPPTSTPWPAPPLPDDPFATKK